MKILVTGATGYIGQLLVPRLLAAGHHVTCMVRDPARLALPEHSRLTVVQGDALQPSTLAAPLASIEVAYYLIHSMADRRDGFEHRDRQAARNFASACKTAGVSRLIYLGGLGQSGAQLSAHLKSRHETGDVLREFGPPVTEFRAAIIVGSGSTSFEIIRYLTERLPVMICPRWVVTRVQPIAVRDVLDYLIAALTVPRSAGNVVEIGGSTLETYRSMMLLYAEVRGLKRWLVRVPVLTPRLSSYWLDLVTPIPSSVSRPLIEGLRSEVICRSTLARELFPGIHPMSYRDAVKSALDRPLPTQILATALRHPSGHQSIRGEGLVCLAQQCPVRSPVAQVFHLIRSVGGKQGWYYANWLWQLRGWLDERVGGVGLRRGRLHPDALHVGDTVDFWRVEDVIPDRRLLLQAEMKVPGRAWLLFELNPETPFRTNLRCSAWFEPRGLLGELYWWITYPIHVPFFRGLLRRIRARAERDFRRPPTSIAPRRAVVNE